MESAINTLGHAVMCCDMFIIATFLQNVICPR